jgi:hypothetical protein
LKKESSFWGEFHELLVAVIYGQKTYLRKS